MRIPRLVYPLVALSVAAGVLRAQAPAPTIRTLDAAARERLVLDVVTAVERSYVDADTGRLIADYVRSRMRDKSYDDITDRAAISATLTSDLRHVNGDLHLSVGEAPRGAPIDAIGFLSRGQHYALGRVDVLPGNVGYLEINGFSGDPGARAAIRDALRYLEATDAIILDLRRNRGGDGALSNYLISHFTRDTVASLRISPRGQPSFVRYTLANVDGPRRPEVPLYVLVSRATGSAGEDAAFVLKNIGRATLVGSNTAGAGHNVMFTPVGDGFRLGISITRVADPRTGEEWERVGVKPQVSVDPTSALDVAHAMIVDSLLRMPTAAQRRTLSLLRETLAARIAGVRPDPALLQSYAGEYEGPRRITTDGVRLFLESPIGAPAEALTSLSDSAFAPASQARLVFQRGSGAPGMRIALTTGDTIAVKRVR